MECHCCSSSDDCSVAFFGAEAEGPEDEEEAALLPRQCSGCCMFSCYYTGAASGMYRLATRRLIPRLLIATACNREQKC